MYEYILMQYNLFIDVIVIFHLVIFYHGLHDKGNNIDHSCSYLDVRINFFGESLLISFKYHRATSCLIHFHPRLSFCFLKLDIRNIIHMHNIFNI